MDSVYEKLFHTYGASVLRELETFPGPEIQALVESLPLSRERRVEVLDACAQHYYQWSADAFVLGLHLGLSLRYDDIRRGGLQQGQ
jgi:hypothetical protein